MTFSIFGPCSQRQYVERVYKPCHEKALVIRPFTLKCVRDAGDINFHLLRKAQGFKCFFDYQLIPEQELPRQFNLATYQT